jgi:hypothetical protein
VSLLDAALAGVRRGPAAVAARSAFVIGNVGKLGAELLNVLLEDPRYERIAVGVRRPMRVMVPKLQTVPVPEALEDWQAAAAIGWIPDDVYLCIEPERVSFWKSAQPYAQLGAGAAARLARRLAAAGTGRAAVLTPLEALLQIGAVPVIRDTDELDMVNAGFARLLILRPSAEERSARGKGFFGAIGTGVAGVLASYMTPKGLQPVRVRRAAQTAVEALHGLDNGVHIIGAERLRELVGDPLDGTRRT